MKEKREKCNQWIKLWMKPSNRQEQSSGGVLQIRFFEKLRKILRKMSVLESLFNEVSRHRDIRLMFLSRSTEKEGLDLYWFIIDLLLIDSKNLAELILSIFFGAFCETWIFYIFSVSLLLRMPFKRKFCVYLILRNRPKLVKKNIHVKIK